LLKQVNEKGFNAFVERTLSNKDQTTYRVRVGPYADLLQAQEIAGELLDRSGYQAVILPPP
jgi:cell division septation protein DedD